MVAVQLVLKQNLNKFLALQLYGFINIPNMLYFIAKVYILMQFSKQLCHDYHYQYWLNVNWSYVTGVLATSNF